MKEEKPLIVCLCGSTRFKDAFDEANYQETMRGRIVLSVGFFMHASGNRHGENIGATPEQKIDLDKLHLRKIDLADEVLVLNVHNYVGASTAREIAYANRIGKQVRYLEPRNTNSICIECSFPYRTEAAEFNPDCTRCCNRVNYP